MAVTAPTIKPFLVGATGNGPAMSVLFYPEGASQGFLAGEFVMLSSGLLVVATDGSILTGIALRDATGTTSATPNIPVAVMDDTTRIVMNLKQGSGADHVYAAADLGLSYDIQVSSHVWSLGAADATDGNFRIQALYPGYAIGDTNVWVYVTPVGINNIQGG